MIIKILKPRLKIFFYLIQNNTTIKFENEIIKIKLKKFVHEKLLIVIKMITNCY